MAQYYQVVDPTHVPTEELPTATYSSLVDGGVHYIIQTNEPNQAFVLDNVIEAPVIQSFPQQQHLFLVSSPPKQAPNMQPVVLNHTLQQPVMLNNAPSLRPLNRGNVVQRPRNPLAGTRGAGPQSLNSRPALRTNPANHPRIARPSTNAIVVNTPAVNSAPINGTEMVKMEDGRILPYADYQKLIEQRKQMQQQVLHRPGHARVARAGPPRPAGRAPIHAPRLPTVVVQQPPPMVQLTKRSNTSKIIPPRSTGRMPRILRDFVPSQEIKDIINTNINDEEFENSVRMFVLLAGGEQRLITFTTPKEECTIQEILEQVGVAVDNNTNIGLNEINKDGINLVVSVGYENDEDDDEIPPLPTAKSNPRNKAHQPLVEAPQVPSPPPEYPEEPPKLIPGKLAVCTHCGFLSEDFNKCQRCRRKLPETIKSILAKSSPQAGKNTKKPAIEINLKPRPGGMGAGSVPGNGTLTPAAANKSAIPPRKRPSRQRKQPDAEMAVVTLSSDEEGDDSSNDKTSLENAAVDKEPTLEALRTAAVVIPKSTGSLACCSINCRTIRIGSYRFNPAHDVALNAKEMLIKMPHTQRKNEIIPITIPRKVVHKVLASFAKTLPVVFIYILPAEAEKICLALGMTPGGESYFNPIAESQQHRRIVLLPTHLGEEDKWVFQTVFSNPYVFEELSQMEANTILIKTCPQDISQALAANNAQNASSSEVRQLLIYPPGKGGISINTEDYICLERDQFLNDVIIDFYLKYMVDQLPDEQRVKVQVFSTFFYTRLTTKPAQNLRKGHPSEIDAALTAAQKRHARVKNWTKNIDLFGKDYIIVPINENAHWFLAIICFPGMQDAETFDGVKVKRELCKRSPTKKVSTTPKQPLAQQIKTIKAPVSEIEDNSDKDEAEGDDSEFEVEDAEDSASGPEQPTAQSMEGVPIKQPCILIFDSLAGTGRSRVVATLRDYLTCEYAAKKKQQLIFTRHVIAGACPKIPQQNNYTDCGLYLLQYVEHFFKAPIHDYRIPIRGLKEWFEELVVTRKREDISNLIKELMVKYNKDVNILPAIALPTQNGEPVPENPSDKEEDDAENTKGLEKMDEESNQGITQGSPMAEADSPGSESQEDSSNSRQSAMSYLKAKRIIKVKSDTPGEAEEPKRRKLQE